jgi:dienelactone hydrolase
VPDWRVLTILLACRPEPGPSYPPDQEELEVLVRDYEDPSRPTEAMGGASASDTRALPTRVWMGPGAGEDLPQRPLLVLLHGLDGHPDKFEAFASVLAEAGIVVAAPAFPVSNRDAGGSANSIADLPNQFVDVGFVVDQLLEDVADEGGPLWARFDPDVIVGLGHSMGGATLLGHTRVGEGDGRFVGQGYLSAAMQLEMLLGGEIVASGPPTLVMQGLEDTLVPPGFGEDLYEKLAEPKWYLGIAGAEHSEAIETQPGESTQSVPEQETSLSAMLALFAEVAGEAGALDAALGACRRLARRRQAESAVADERPGRGRAAVRRARAAPAYCATS